MHNGRLRHINSSYRQFYRNVWDGLEMYVIAEIAGRLIVHTDPLGIQLHI